ncbi:hypothetical protein OIU84_020301 [Salix udensis]|uniref:protein-serine/threonine phosphatase n=1 Tax=Salix udensis TaxID=889485 RepID=A0AAD6PFJ8_9ROSI|nr:hypothetical protein OIU84_020301 [Salix udensis]
MESSPNLVYLNCYNEKKCVNCCDSFHLISIFQEGNFAFLIISLWIVIYVIRYNFYLCQVYGFYDECQRKYGNANAWRYCTDVFDYLTLSAIIDGTVLCVHGGLSPDIRTIDQIRVIERNCEIPHEGPFCDLMWSDPEEIETWAVSPRGAGWLFGSRVTTEFNHINNLDLVCRAHQLVQEGLKYMFQDKGLVTVWSAPNYCYRCGNVASILSFSENMEREVKFFTETEENNQMRGPRTGMELPFVLGAEPLPFSQGFSWGFVACCTVLSKLLNYGGIKFTKLDQVSTFSFPLMSMAESIISRARSEESTRQNMLTEIRGKSILINIQCSRKQVTAKLSSQGNQSQFHASSTTQISLFSPSSRTYTRYQPRVMTDQDNSTSEFILRIGQGIHAPHIKMICEDNLICSRGETIMTGQSKFAKLPPHSPPVY